MFADNFYPELSGLADSIMTAARELSKRGHYIEFYVPRYSKKDFAIVGLPKGEINLGDRVSVVRLPSFHASSGTGQGRAVVPMPWHWHHVKKFNPDVIHVHLFFGTGIEGLIAGRKLKKPIIGTNHTALDESMFLPYVPFHSKKIVELIQRYIIWFYGKCALITAPSRVVIEDMQFRGFKKECHVISNPIDTDLFAPLPNKNWLRKRLGCPENTIIHAGRLATERNIDVTLRAIAIVKQKIPDVQLLLAGRGAAEGDLKKLSRDLGIEKNVIFMGFLEKPKLAEAYNASKIFVITSTTDTQSMVLMQAMATGLPAIAAKAGGPMEYIKRSNGFLVEPGDHRTLAKKIIYLLKNPEARKKLGDGARTFANKFSAPEIAKEWEAIYQKVIGGYNNRK